MANLGCMPKEVVEEIMSWLPADSMLGCKLVSKDWHGLIRSLVDDPDFVAKHLENAKKRASLGLHLIPQELDRGETECEEIEGFTRMTLLNDNIEDGDLIRSSTEHLRLALSPIEIQSGYSKVGHEEIYHCDGIILRVISGEIVIVCNPVLKQFNVFPGPDYDRKRVDFGPMCGGFGYDSTTDTYKIVRVYHNQSSGITRAKVYTLGRLFWREVKFPQRVKNIAADGLYFSGVCYWVFGVRSVKKNILCFDLCSEKFRVLPTPDVTKAPEALGWLKLVEWNDKIACLHVSSISGAESRVEIFVMDSSPDMAKGACSWTKNLNIRFEIDIDAVLMFWKSDELLLLDSSMNLVAYNLLTKKHRYFSIDGVGRVEFKSAFRWPILYVNSLVSISGKFTGEFDPQDLFFLFDS